MNSFSFNFYCKTKNKNIVTNTNDYLTNIAHGSYITYDADVIYNYATHNKVPKIVAPSHVTLGYFNV